MLRKSANPLFQGGSPKNAHAHMYTDRYICIYIYMHACVRICLLVRAILRLGGWAGQRNLHRKLLAQSSKCLIVSAEHAHPETPITYSVVEIFIPAF